MYCKIHEHVAIVAANFFELPVDNNPKSLAILTHTYYPLNVHHHFHIARNIIVCVPKKEYIPSDAPSHVRFIVCAPEISFQRSDVFAVDTSVRREFDLFLNAAWVPWKRNYLASLVPRTVNAGYDHGKGAVEIPSFCHVANKNPDGTMRILSKQEIADLCKRSHCGGIFSKSEGNCRAIGEYLLSGIPVISTPSVGGRDVWFDEYNSLIVAPNPETIRQGVQRLVRESRDPLVIRNTHLKRMEEDRKVLFDVVETFFEDVPKDWKFDSREELEHRLTSGVRRCFALDSSDVLSVPRT